MESASNPSSSFDVLKNQEEEYDLQEVLKDLKNSEYEDYKQLVYLGKIVDEYEIFGHTFKVHSLTAEEEIRLSAYLANYSDALTYTKALYIECLSYIIDEVDGKRLTPMPLEEGGTDSIDEKRKIIGKWSPLVIAELYENIYLDLRKRERAVVEHVKKSHRVGRRNFSSDSCTEGEILQGPLSIP